MRTAPLGVIALCLLLAVSPVSAGGQAGALLQAARDGNLPALLERLHDGADVEAAEGDGTRALHYAAWRSDAGAVAALLAAGADANAPTHLQVTPLLLACEQGDAAVVSSLLQAGADPHRRNVSGETPLMVAARVGEADVVAALLRHGADVNAVDEHFEQTALMQAARHGAHEVVALLLEAGAALHARTRVGPVPPFRGIGGTRGEGVEKSPERGARDAIPGGKTALLYAAREGHLPVVRALLDAGAPVDERDPNDITPLLMAISNGHADVARHLIERGADINADDWYGRTPLWAAIDFRNVDTPLPAQGNGADRPAMLELIEHLLQLGAMPDARIREMPVVRRHVLPLGSLSWVDFTGETPFIRAALAGDVRTMRLLLAHGADPLLATSLGTTALAAAAGVNWTVAQTFDEGPEALLEAVRIAHEAGVDPDAANSKGIRAIHGAANRGSNAIVAYLAAAGASLDATDGEGRSPLDWANGVFLATHPPETKPETVALLEDLLASQQAGAAPAISQQHH